MSVLTYPAIIKEDNHNYYLEFVDLKGCFSCGESIEETIENAKEALGLYLDNENEIIKKDISKPSSLDKVIKKYPNNTIVLIQYDSIEYNRKYKNKAIKKTLTIPEWINDIAVKNNINFSQVLQEALLYKLNIK